jgi:hypothetical protein
MRTLSILAALAAALTIPGALAACGSSPKAATAAPSPTPVFTDPMGKTCAPTALAGYNGQYCPGDPEYRDPNGVQCAATAATGPGDAWCPGDEPQASDSASYSEPATPTIDSEPAAPTMTRQTDKVLFKVWGSGYPSVQYGSDSDSRSPAGGYGPLGDGNALPWSASVTYDPSALYYAVSAQLEGYGDISDSVTEVITTYCSDGSHKTESFPLAHGHASGGYNIAQAEYAGGDTGNAAQAESDAGC